MILRLRWLSLTWQIFWRAHKPIFFKCGPQTSSIGLEQILGSLYKFSPKFNRNFKRWGPAVCDTTAARWFWSTLKFENHYHNTGCQWNTIDDELYLMIIFPYTKRCEFSLLQCPSPSPPVLWFSLTVYSILLCDVVSIV